jgi:hypothetical protein
MRGRLRRLDRVREPAAPPWWTVHAPDPGAALALLPPFVAVRTITTEVREVEIP